MIQEVVSVDLPVHERLVIKKNRLEPENMTGKEKRISIVTLMVMSLTGSISAMR